jgi:hypothetical protein
VLAQDRQRGSVSFSLQESVSLLKKSLLKRLVVPKQVQNAPDTCQTGVYIARGALARYV